MGVEADIALLARDVGRIAQALEHLVAEQPSAPTGTPELQRFHARLPQLDDEAGAVALWSKASPVLSEADRPVAWRALVARLHTLRGLREVESSLLAAVAAAPKSSATNSTGTATGKTSRNTTGRRP